MRLLCASFEHQSMFKDGQAVIDLFAEDKVPAGDGSVHCLSKPVYTNNVVALAGINATGKTTVLGLLELAINIIDGKPIANSVSNGAMLYRIRLGMVLRLVFEHDGELYALVSQIGMTSSPLSGVRHWKDAISFTNETLYHWPSSKMPTKQLLSDIDGLVKRCEVRLERGSMTAAESMFLSHDVSIAASVSGRNTACAYQSALDIGEGFDVGFEGALETLQVFDPGIRSFELQEDGKSCVVIFESGYVAHTTTDLLGMYLSSGTIKGLEVVRKAVGVLAQGGYLLVDEIENHLNKQLVSVLIDLFQSSETNPYGATLLFSTHYPEILDRVHRKDNVYFLSRDSDSHTIQVVKYSSRVKRIENKKSEVFISNYIGGTAPRYSDVQALRALVREAVGHEAS